MLINDLCGMVCRCESVLYVAMLDSTLIAFSMKIMLCFEILSRDISILVWVKELHALVHRYEYAYHVAIFSCS